MSTSSPCIGVCALDNDDICIGCFRTADDITEWQLMTEREQKVAVLNAAERAQEKGFTL